MAKPGGQHAKSGTHPDRGRCLRGDAHFSLFALWPGVAHLSLMSPNAGDVRGERGRLTVTSPARAGEAQILDEDEFDAHSTSKCEAPQSIQDDELDMECQHRSFTRRV